MHFVTNELHMFASLKCVKFIPPYILYDLYVNMLIYVKIEALYYRALQSAILKTNA